MYDPLLWLNLMGLVLQAVADAIALTLERARVRIYGGLVLAAGGEIGT
jgi:hypothetical protein